MQNSIIELRENEAQVSHRVIALNVGRKEISIRNVILKYIGDIEEFGKLHFKSEAIKNSKNKVNEVKEYFLNEQQATLLFTYLRNNETVRAFKINLVKAFYKMKQELYQKEANTHNNQIRGYKSQLAQHNKKIEFLQEKVLFLEKRVENDAKNIEQSKSLLDTVDEPYTVTEVLDATSIQSDMLKWKETTKNFEVVVDKLQYQNKMLKQTLVHIKDKYHNIVQKADNQVEAMRVELKKMTNVFQQLPCIANDGKNLNIDTESHHKYWT